MANQDYLYATCEKFQKVIGPWFEEEHVITSSKIKDISPKLKSLTSLKRDVIVEFDKQYSLSPLSKFIQEGLKVTLGYELYNQAEQMRKEHFDFKPESFMSFLDPNGFHGHFVAIKALDVEKIFHDELKEEETFEQLGNGIILIYPRGSQYSKESSAFSNSRKDHLFEIIKNFKDFYI